MKQPGPDGRLLVDLDSLDRADKLQAAAEHRRKEFEAWYGAAVLDDPIRDDGYYSGLQGLCWDIYCEAYNDGVEDERKRH